MAASPMSVEQLIIDGDISELGRAFALIEEFAERVGLSADMRMRISFVAEEIIVNVIVHGYGDRSKGQIVISLWQDDGLTMLGITDSAPPFNPLNKGGSVDIDAELSDRPVGGLGILLTMRHVTGSKYRFVDGQNTLVLIFKDK